jgi:replicative DNA helicase
MDIIQFERDLIRGLIRGLDSRRLMARLNIDYFETLQLRKIYQAIEDYHKRFSEIPQSDILINELKKIGVDKDELNNMSAFLTKDDNIAEDRFKYAIEELEKAYISRKLKVSMKEAIAWLDKGDPKKAQDVLLKDTIDLSSFGREVRVLDFVDDFEERKNVLLKQRDNPEMIKQICIPTGIQDLDPELDGGLRKGELGLFLAPPEGGKSISLQDISVSAMLQGFKVALITIEMTPEQTAYRLDSRLTEMRYRKFRRAKLTDDEIAAWESNVKKMKANSLKIIGVPEGCSCRLIESEMARIQGLFQPDLVVVDYAGIMSPNEGSYSSTMDWKYVGSILRNLKGLALKWNIPVWSAAQLLVQTKEKSEVAFVDIGLARQQIAAHVDIAIAIIQTSQMRAMDETKLQFVKCREGCDNRIIKIKSDYDIIRLSVGAGDKENQ